MKPAPFRYLTPTSVDECVAMLAEHGDDVKLLAGGQSLVPLMNLRLAAPEVLLDLNVLPELSYVREEGDQLVIGAMTRHRDVAGSPVVRAACPLIADAAVHIGHAAIRNRGTIGGSLAHADPASELPLVAVTLGAELVATGPGGRRVVSAGEFFVSHFTTALAPDELLLEVRLPRSAPGACHHFEEFSRKAGDFALVSVAAELRLDGGLVEGAAVGIGGVGDRPWRSTGAEEALLSSPPSADRLAAAAERAVADADDSGFGDGYRRHVLQTLVRRALSAATAKAGAG